MVFYKCHFPCFHTYTQEVCLFCSVVAYACVKLKTKGLFLQKYCFPIWINVLVRLLISWLKVLPLGFLELNVNTLKWKHYTPDYFFKWKMIGNSCGNVLLSLSFSVASDWALQKTEFWASSLCLGYDFGADVQGPTYFATCLFLNWQVTSLFEGLSEDNLLFGSALS